MEKVKRGEIYLHDFGSNAGSIQNGVGPVLVVQCDEGNQASTQDFAIRHLFFIFVTHLL